MSTIWVAAIIIAITVIPPFILIRLNMRRQKARQRALRADFSKAGAKHGLSFKHQEILKDKILGLDANNQTLLVFFFDQALPETVVNLTHLGACTVYKEYQRFPVSDRKDSKTEQVLTEMGLKLEFLNNSPSLQIGFYNNHVNGIYDFVELEQKAKAWEGLVAPKTSRNTRRA